MGWQGSGGLAVATSGSTIWFGGVLLFLAGIGEFLLGNNFPMIVFLSYGAHLMAYATTFSKSTLDGIGIYEMRHILTKLIVPFFNAVGFFNPDGSGLGSPGAKNQTPVFYASFGE